MATLFIKTIKSDNICDNSALCVLRLSETEKLVGKGKRPIDVSTSEAEPRCHCSHAPPPPRTPLPPPLAALRRHWMPSCYCFYRRRRAADTRTPPPPICHSL